MGLWDVLEGAGVLGRGDSLSKGKEKIWQGCVVGIVNTGVCAHTCMCTLVYIHVSVYVYVHVCGLYVCLGVILADSLAEVWTLREQCLWCCVLNACWGQRGGGIEGVNLEVGPWQEWPELQHRWWVLRGAGVVRDRKSVV